MAVPFCETKPEHQEVLKAAHGERSGDQKRGKNSLCAVYKALLGCPACAQINQLITL